MSWAPMYAGRLTLAERPGGVFEDSTHATTLARSSSWEGQESSPPLPVYQVAARQDDLLGLMRRLVPVRFTEKPERDGYYEIVDTNAALSAFGSEVVTCTWTLRAEKMGSDSEVDLESILSGALTRTNAHSITGERWHAPPAGHYAYTLATGTPSTLSVTGAEGALTVYRNVAVGVNPRWGCSVADYGSYRARFIDNAGLERTGYPPRLAAVGWQLHNSLVRLSVNSSGHLLVASHDGTSWEEKAWQVTVAGTLLSTAPAQAVVIRNDYEAATVRLLWSRAPGRVQLDLTIRRGARWVEGHLQTLPGGVTLVVGLVTPETTTAGTGHITATGNDGAGNRFLGGTAATFTAGTGDSSMTVTSAAAMNFMVGSVVGGGSAPAGDQAANHIARWLGSAAEVTRAFRR
jgi:hypothetical protein